MTSFNTNMLNRHHILFHKKIFCLLTTALFISTSLISTNVEAGFDTLTFKPATDQGYYLTVHQSKTLGKMGHAIGLMTDYSVNSLIVENAAGVKIQDVIQKQVGMTLGGALGLTPWLDVGASISGVPYQQFVTPTTLVQDNGARLGDISANAKIQLINSEENSVGLALVPFMTFPTGDDDHFVGDSGFTGGGKVVIDTKRISDRVSFSANAGGVVRNDVVLTPGTNVVGDQFLYGAAVNVEVAKPVQLIAEVRGSTEFSNFFEDHNRNLEIDGAVRFLPGENKNWLITLGGGAGLLSGAGDPDYRLFTSLALRFPHKEEAPVVQPIREKVISTNEIHFAFNKSAIKPASYPVLDKILADIQSSSEIESVRVEGHTDNIGSDEYNQKLSLARAESVRQFFIDRGYPAHKINAVGMGETTPTADNTTKAGRALNRRTELHLLLNNNSNTRVKKSTESSPTFEEGDPR